MMQYIYRQDTQTTSEIDTEHGQMPRKMSDTNKV